MKNKWIAFVMALMVMCLPAMPVLFDSAQAAIQEQTPVNSYTGNGVTTTFPYTWKIFVNTDIKVTVAGVLKTLTTDYTVTGAGQEAGGNVVFVTAPASGTAVVIYRDLTYSRSTDYVEHGDFLASTVDDDFDRTVMLTQQLKEGEDRTLKVAIGSSLNPIVPILANKVIGWDSAGTALTTYSTTPVYSANFDTIQNYSNSLAAAVAAIGAGQKTLLIDVANNVTDNLVVPSNITLMYLQGAITTVSAGKTLTINSNIDAGSYEIFNGTGTVTFGAGAVEAVYPEWVGTSLNEAISAIGSTEVDLLITSQISMTGNAIVPSTMRLVFAKGGSINQSTYTLTINGQINAGLYQIFYGTGTVSFSTGSVEAVYPEWYGAVSGSGANQATNATALQATLNTLVTMYKTGVRDLPPIVFSGRYFYSGAGLTLSTVSGDDITGLTIEGISGGVWEANGGVEGRWSGLHYTGTGIAFTAGASSDVAFVRSSIFRNWQLTGTASSTGGFLADEVHASLFENFISAGFTATNAYGFKNTRGIGNVFFNVAFYGNYNGLSIGRNYNTFYKSRFVFNNNYGVLDVDSLKTTLNDCHIEGNTAGGIYINNTSAGGYFTLNDGWIENNGGYQIYLEGANGTTRHSYPSINNTIINTAAGGATAHISLTWTDHARINPIWLNASIPQVEDVGTNTALWTNYLFNISGAQGSAGGFDSYGLNNGGGSPDRLYFASQAADIATKPGGCFVLPNSDADITDADHVSSITNEIQLSGVDLSAGNTILRIDTEGTGIISQPGDGPATRRVRININGTVYNLLAE